MATNNPAAVAISPSAIGCATTPRLVLPADAIPWNAITIPHTVPNNPMNGVLLAVGATNGTRGSENRSPLLQLAELDGARPQERPIDRVEALQRWTRRRRARLGGVALVG